jgi:hypothetical protein
MGDDRTKRATPASAGDVVTIEVQGVDPVEWEATPEGGMRISPSWFGKLTREQQARIRCAFDLGHEDERLIDCVRRLLAD